MKEDWKDMVFELSPYRETVNLKIHHELGLKSIFENCDFF